jgi:hypothetical protein
MRPVLWLCVIAIALPLDSTWCNTQNRWCSVNTLLTLWWRYGDAALMRCWRSSCRVVTMTYTTLPIQAANTSIVDISRSCGLGWFRCNAETFWRSVCAELTLGCHSFLGGATSILTIMTIKERNSLIMGTSHSKALGLYKMHHPKSMTLCWLLFSECGCDHVAFSCAHKGCQYVDYG